MKRSTALFVLNQCRQCGGVLGANNEPAWHVGTPTGLMTQREGETHAQHALLTRDGGKDMYINTHKHSVTRIVFLNSWEVIWYCMLLCDKHTLPKSVSVCMLAAPLTTKWNCWMDVGETMFSVSQPVIAEIFQSGPEWWTNQPTRLQTNSVLSCSPAY